MAKGEGKKKPTTKKPVSRADFIERRWRPSTTPPLLKKSKRRS